MLSNPQQLTRLDLSAMDGHVCVLEAGVLLGKTRLQRLQLANYRMSDGAAGVAQLLLQLQHLQQLTVLRMEQQQDVPWQGQQPQPDFAPAAAYSALTASSNLQHLKINIETLPAGAWQHVFPAGERLPRMRNLYIWGLNNGVAGAATSPDTSSLVRCCHRLCTLAIDASQQTAGLLAPLTGLTRLHHLNVAAEQGSEGLVGLCQLKQLRGLDVWIMGPDWGAGEAERLLLQLTQLRQLTNLAFNAHPEFRRGTCSLSAKVSPRCRIVLVL
jgi:hypothetical protein